MSLPSPPPTLHPLLLLSDSALPLGSFAFSSGLESFLAHHHKSLTTSTSPTNNAPSQTLSAFKTFLSQSLYNLASTALPYVLAAYRDPQSLRVLDNDMDASMPCTVARRASVTQGRALVQVWERALKDLSSSSCAVGDDDERSPGRGQSWEAMQEFAKALKHANEPDEFGFGLQAHFAPLFGVVCAALELGEQEMVYVFLLNHAKAVLSAAVRASVMGPYQSQAVLASMELRQTIQRCMEQEGEGMRGRGVEEAVVTVPMMDLWMGRHELLYSRIFNS